MQALQSLPLQSVLCLVGQGYKVITAGFKFGAMLAHLFACRLMLQLKEEVAMAKQIGISLPDLLSANKVRATATQPPHGTHSGCDAASPPSRVWLEPC